MKISGKKGFTLIEILIVVGLIVLLAGMLIKAGGAIINTGKKKQTENTISTLVSALSEYKNYGYQYPGAGYDKFIFPLDCTNFTAVNLMTELNTAMNLNISEIRNLENKYSSCGAMYYILNKISASRKILDKIDPSLVTNKNSSHNNMFIKINPNDYPLLYVVDGWGTELRYDYYDQTAALSGRIASKRSFPVLISAGPDRLFNGDIDINGNLIISTDDITSR